MNEQLTRPIETITAEIQFYKRQAGVSILEIGKRLTEAKEQLNHGEWLKWLEEEVDVSASMAQKMMKVAREYANTESIPYLGVTKALALLSIPAEEREEFAEAVNAEALSVRELKEAIRQREAERDTAYQEREAAEQSRLEMERRLGRSERECLTLQGKVHELENRPVETVTVDASDAQIAAAEQRGREQLRQEAEQVRQQAAQTQNQLQAQIASLEREADQQKEKIAALTIAAQEKASGSKTAQTLGEINGRLRAIQEADRRISELMDGLDEMTRRRVMEARRQLLSRMLGEASV